VFDDLPDAEKADIVEFIKALQIKVAE